MWKELYASLDTKAAAGKAFAKPKAADLDKAEAKLKAKLPASYRAFAEQFGAGDLGDYFRIKVPVKGGKPTTDLTGFVAFVRDNAEMYGDIYGDPAFVKRMLPFGATAGGDILVWDPKAPTDKAANEYPVFVLPDGKDKIVKVAPDFATFVTKGVFGPDFGKAIKAKKWSVKKSFLPWGDKTPGA